MKEIQFIRLGLPSSGDDVAWGIAGYNHPFWQTPYSPAWGF